jgi:hypothetical protein
MSISSVNLGQSNSLYVEQDKSKANNSTQTNSTQSTNSTTLDNSDNKASSASTNAQTQTSTKPSDSLTREAQFGASFQKSQLLSKLPSDATKDTAKQTPNNSTVKETSAASSTKELGDYGHLSNGQKRLVDDLANRQNSVNKTNLSPSEFYNKLEPSRKSTFESITNALENTNVVGKDGKKTNALDAIDHVDTILGENKGKGGEDQFRLIVSTKDGAKDNISTAKNFHEVKGHGDKYPDSYQLNGGEPSFQISFTRDGKNADIDVDYESKNVVVNLLNGFKHLQPSNSDVRHGDHFKKHNERFASEPWQQPLVKKY